MSRCRIIFLVLITTFLSGPIGLVVADITLPKIFSDYMVLQRNSSVEIWGTAEANQKLVLTFAGEKKLFQADANGDWSITLDTAAAGGPYQMEITAVEGAPKIVFSEVMIGEVWICSGQSNMDWPTSQALNPETELEHAKKYPNLRFFTVKPKASSQPLSDVAEAIPWRACSPETVANFSATAYFFGRELSKQLDGIPIGLINSSMGGTCAEAWVSSSSLENVDALAPLLKHWQDNNDLNHQNRPANLFNGMIAPLTRYKVRGAIWYQGESNNERGVQYATLLPTLIADWRSSFDLPEMPFYFVQLAPHRYKEKSFNALPEMWDAQLKTMRRVPHSGIAVTGDIGNLDDIHPKNKQDVGRRLALLALYNLYRDQLPVEQQDFECSGPIYQSMTIRGEKVRLAFAHTGDGLKLRDETKPLTLFSVCGADQRFVTATATIEENEVVVSSKEVVEPVAVRFGWIDTAEPNLVNSAGLPAMPFRTDDFPMESAGKNY